MSLLDFIRKTPVDWHSPLPVDECRRRLKAEANIVSTFRACVMTWGEKKPLTGTLRGSRLALRLRASQLASRADDPWFHGTLVAEARGTRIVGQCGSLYFALSVFFILVLAGCVTIGRVAVAFANAAPGTSPGVLVMVTLVVAMLLGGLLYTLYRSRREVPVILTHLRKILEIPDESGKR